MDKFVECFSGLVDPRKKQAKHDLTEILFIALKRGFRIDEVPVSWAHDERSRMSYLKDGLQMLKELAIVRWNALTGRYSKRIEAILRTGESR